MQRRSCWAVADHIVAFRRQIPRASTRGRVDADVVVRGFDVALFSVCCAPCSGVARLEDIEEKLLTVRETNPPAVDEPGNGCDPARHSHYDHVCTQNRAFGNV